MVSNETLVCMRKKNCGKIFMANADGMVGRCFGHDICSDQCANEFMNGKRENFEMSKNYIVINGKKRQLSEEQLKSLEIKENPYERVDRNDLYYYIDYNCDTYCAMREAFDCWDTQRYDYANYFNDAQFAQQIALHQLLYRKLLKFAWDNEAEDIEWDGNNEHYYICYDYYWHYFYVEMSYHCKSANVFFSQKTVAQKAIKEVIEPFMEVNSDFVW